MHLSNKGDKALSPYDVSFCELASGQGAYQARVRISVRRGSRGPSASQEARHTDACPVLAGCRAVMRAITVLQGPLPVSFESSEGEAGVKAVKAAFEGQTHVLCEFSSMPDAATVNAAVHKLVEIINEPWQVKATTA